MNEGIKIKLCHNPRYVTDIMQRVYAIDDTVISTKDEFLPGDDKPARIAKRDTQIRKLNMRKLRLETILTAYKQDGMILLQQFKRKILKDIHEQLIWHALAKGDQETFDGLVVQRDALLVESNLVETIPQSLATIDQHLTELNKITGDEKFETMGDVLRSYNFTEAEGASAPEPAT